MEERRENSMRGEGRENEGVEKGVVERENAHGGMEGENVGGENTLGHWQR